MAKSTVLTTDFLFSFPNALRRFNSPNYIQEMFSLQSNGYSLRGHLKVVLPRPTSSYMQHSFTYQASKQWNNLTDKIRMSESLSIFRENLQDIQLSSRMTAAVCFVNK